MKHSSVKFPAAKRTTASLCAGLVSCLVCLSILSVLIRDALGAPDGVAGIAPATAPGHHALKIVAVDTGKPKLTVTDGDGQRIIDLSEDLRVQLNGAPATIEEIAPGDSVTVETDEHNRVTGLDVTRLQAGIVMKVGGGAIEVTTDYTDQHRFQLTDDAQVLLNGGESRLEDLRRGDQARISPNRIGLARKVDVTRRSLIAQFWENFRHNLFKPLLLFFYMGFLVPMLKGRIRVPACDLSGVDHLSAGRDRMARGRGTRGAQVGARRAMGVHAHRVHHELRHRRSRLLRARRSLTCGWWTRPRLRAITGPTRRARSSPAWECRPR